MAKKSAEILLENSTVARYGFAVLATALATSLRAMFTPVLGYQIPYATFFLAVLCSAWFCGYGPAFLSLVLGAVCAALWFLPHDAFGLDEQLGMLIFLLVGSGIAHLGGRMRSSAYLAAAERQRLETTLYSIGDAVITTDAAGRITTMNPVAAALTGWTAAAAEGLPLADVFVIHNEATGEPSDNPVDKVLRTGAVVGLANHTVLLAKGGEIRPIDDSAAPIRNPQGEIIGVVLVFRDVTERRATELALQTNHARNQAILESALDCIITMDHAGKIIEFNPAAERTFGYTRQQAVGAQMAELLVPPYLRTAQYEGMAYFLRTGEGPVLDKRIHVPALRADGSEFPAELAVTRIPVDGPPMFTAHLRDVSRDQQAQQAISTSEQRFRQLADSMPQIVWTTNASGEIDYLNQLWYEYTGLPVTTPCEEAWQAAFFPDHVPLYRQAWTAAQAEGGPLQLEVLLRAASGQYRWHIVRSAAVRDEQGQIVRWFGTSTDVHQQKQASVRQSFLADASAALVGSLEYRSILAAVAEHAVPSLADYCFFDILTPDGTIERVGLKHVDPQEQELVERLRMFAPPAHMRDHPVTKVVLSGRADLVTDVDEAWMQRVATCPEHLECVRQLQPGSIMMVPLVSAERVLGAMTFCYRTSGRQHTSEQLELAQELAHRTAVVVENAKLYTQLQDADRRKDEFLAMLAHELRNPLAPIRNALELLTPDVDPETADWAKSVMQRQVQHIVRLVDDLLDVSRITQGKIQLRIESVELSSALFHAVEEAKPTIHAQEQQFSISLPDKPVWLRADPIRLSQIISNLLTNAAKYTGRQGQIRLKAELDGEEVVLCVRDTGIGIEPDMLDKIFRPFTQVTDSLDRSLGGLGIGLALVRSLVEMHDGTVHAVSAGLGQGSEFIVRLPVAAAATHEKPVWKPTTVPARRILVVDDNYGAAVTLAQLLSKFWGHTVEVAHDGTAALEKAEQFAPQVVLLDIGLPGISGYDVAKRLRAQPRFDATLLVALTGYGQDEDRRRSLEAGFDEHLVKPASVVSLQALAMHPKWGNGAG